MNIIEHWKQWLEDRKAKKRGEVRVATTSRGRIYEKPDEDGHILAGVKYKLTITGRVYRASTGTWEPLPPVHTPE